jgi:hypothetical protein
VISIDLPETRSSRMELVGETRQEMSGERSAVLEPGSWIELSEPASVTLGKESTNVDQELAQFLAAGDGSFRYDYVRLGCSFHADSPERFDKAWLSVNLKAGESDAGEGPICWSIFPLGDYDPRKETTSAEIGSTGKILTAKIGVGQEISRKIYSVRGYREGNANPYWELLSTPATALEGALRFHMVVRSGAKSGTVGQVRLEAVISNKVFVAFRQKRPFDQSPSQEFHLLPL